MGLGSPPSLAESWDKSFLYPHLAKTFFFPFSSKTPERKKPYLSASPSLTFRWFSFFLLSLHACWTSWFHVLVGQLHSYIRAHRLQICLFLSPGPDIYTFQAFMDTWVCAQILLVNLACEICIHFSFQQNSCPLWKCLSIKYSTIHLSILLSMLLWLALLMICFAITNAAAITLTHVCCC